MKNRFLDAAAFLLAVVVKEPEGVFAKGQDGHEVAGGTSRQSS